MTDWVVKQYVQRSSRFLVCIWIARCLSMLRGSQISHM